MVDFLMAPCEQLSVESLAEKLGLPNDFIATGTLRPSPLTRVDNQALPDELLDRFLNCELYFGRICRPIFSWHLDFLPRVELSVVFDCHPERLFRPWSM